MFLIINNLTFIPDSISTNDLLRLQVDAEADFVPEDEKDLDSFIEATIEMFQAEHKGPAASKALVLRILSQLGAWHDFVADKKFKENDESCLLWAADEKLIHMAFSCLERVDLGDQECTCNND